MEKANLELELKFGDGGNYKPPPQPDVMTLWKKCVVAEEARDYSALSDRDWRNAPWCLWLKVGDVIPLVQRTSFTRAYGQWIQSRQFKGDYRLLVQAWLMYFSRSNPPRSSATLIIHACNQWPDWLWTKRHVLHQIFDVKHGPSLLAHRVLSEPELVWDVLRDHGLGEWLQTGGFSEAAFAELLTDLPRRLRTSVSEARTQQLIERTITWAQSQAGDLRFPELSAAIAEALLLPWINTNPPPAIEKQLVIFLIAPSVMGDPRFQKTKWQGVKPEASSVLERWLNRETLNAFVRIIREATKHDPVAKDHWRARRAFWMAYHDAGHISKVWIALGRDAEDIARRHTNLQGQFGKLTKNPIANHSVLMLQIGSLLVTDWSHNGSCRIWTNTAAQRLKFKMYEPEYWGTELRTRANLEKAHQGDWQRVVHQFIYDETGILVSGYYE